MPDSSSPTPTKNRNSSETTTAARIGAGTVRTATASVLVGRELTTGGLDVGGRRGDTCTRPFTATTSAVHLASTRPDGP